MYVELLNTINKQWDNLAPALPVTFRQPFETGKEAIIKELDQLAAAVNQIKGDTDLTGEAQQRQINEALAAARARIDENMQKLIKLVQDLKTKLQRQLTPEKPKTVDYGELANLKADLRMVIDALGLRQALNRMALALEEALISGDSLTVWLLGGSNWPFLYLESRGITNRAEWEDARDKALAKVASEEQIKARNLLQKLEGTSGVEGVVKSLRFYAGVRLDSMK